jgi:hypothetical protein
VRKPKLLKVRPGRDSADVAKLETATVGMSSEMVDNMLARDNLTMDIRAAVKEAIENGLSESEIVMEVFATLSMALMRR